MAILNIIPRNSFKSVVKVKTKDGEVDGKYCKGGCKEFKPLEMFHKDAKGVGGRKAFCNSCRSQLVRERYKANK